MSRRAHRAAAEREQGMERGHLVCIALTSHLAISGKQRSSSDLVRPVSHGAPRRSRSIGSTAYGALHPAKPPVAVCIARVSGEVAISCTSEKSTLRVRRSCKSATCASPSDVSSGSTIPQFMIVRLCAPCPCRTKQTRFVDMSALAGDSIGEYLSALIDAGWSEPHAHLRAASRAMYTTSRAAWCRTTSVQCGHTCCEGSTSGHSSRSAGRRSMPVGDMSARLGWQPAQYERNGSTRNRMRS